MKYAMFVLVIVISWIGFGVFGALTYKALAPMTVSQTREWMPIKLVDGDMAKLLGLTKKGDTYTRYATIDGRWGIVAVRQSGGIWIVPCQEPGETVAGGKR